MVSVRLLNLVEKLYMWKSQTCMCAKNLKYLDLEDLDRIRLKRSRDKGDKVIYPQMLISMIGD